MSKHLKWIQQLSKACDGDVGNAKIQLVWLKEKNISDRPSIGTKALSAKEQVQLEQYITERVEHNKPLQYILGEGHTHDPPPFLIDTKTRR
jgi:release factor glutamine methyltransferase